MPPIFCALLNLVSPRNCSKKTYNKTIPHPTEKVFFLINLNTWLRAWSANTCCAMSCVRVDNPWWLVPHRSLVTMKALTRVWPRLDSIPFARCNYVWKTNKTKNRNAFLMKCENCLFAFANHRHDNGKF